MSLQIQYSKQIAKELGKVGVYLPGEDVKVGDIIMFPAGKKGIFKKSVPWGSFIRNTSLQALNIPFVETQPSPDTNTYEFSSVKSVDSNINASTNVDLGYTALPQVDFKLKKKFQSEGAIYLLAVDCYKTSIENILDLEHKIQQQSDLIWEDTFLVTGLTTAKKALFAQSNTRNAELIIGGDVQGIKSGAINTDAGLFIDTKNSKGIALVKDWSDQVPVFMELMKMEQEVFGVEKGAQTHQDIPSGDQVEGESHVLLKHIAVSEYLQVESQIHL